MRLSIICLIALPLVVSFVSYKKVTFWKDIDKSGKRYNVMVGACTTIPRDSGIRSGVSSMATYGECFALYKDEDCSNYQYLNSIQSEPDGYANLHNSRSLSRYTKDIRSIRHCNYISMYA